MTVSLEIADADAEVGIGRTLSAEPYGHLLRRFLGLRDVQARGTGVIPPPFVLTIM